MSEEARAAAEADEERPLVVLADVAEDEDDEVGVEALRSGLDCEVVTLDPALLDAEAFGRLGEASAVIVPWDLGTQAGLDVVEALRSDERTREIPIVMASAAPTRAAVTLALRAGATGFIFQPMDPEDVRRHLEASSAPPRTHPAQDAPEAEEGTHDPAAGADAEPPTSEADEAS